jgi:catechol 2,3-dioxygenase-like lactoylglutathione lyase family enzyme
MRPTSVAVGIPVTDLDRAVGWYQKAFELGEPDLRPMDGLVEFDLGPFWLQLTVSPESAGVAGVSVNLSVGDAAGERQRFAGLGLSVSELQHIEGVVDYFELTDPDGNRLGFVTELA